jgi:hypothetical protein
MIIHGPRRGHVGDLSPGAREGVAFLLRNEGVDHDAAQQIIRFPLSSAFRYPARWRRQLRSRSSLVVSSSDDLDTMPS